MEKIEYNILRPVFNQDLFDGLHGYEKRKRKIKNFNYYEYLNIQKIGSILTNTLPFFKWIKDYQLGFLPSDIAAGITIAIFNIPQGMAYANLANLPEVIGLYTSFFCPLIYLFFGTSRHLSMGIVSVVALMMGSTLEKYAILHNFNLENAKQNNIDNFESLHYLTILTFTTGIILALLSLCQAHFIAAYLSDSLEFLLLAALDS
uniref:SLC26A/SulP transporter domain-containing protein n=1 Tax=Acrobeloides nanus TaxID=290746 RepID=A0A914E6H9_9BILA